MALGHSGRDTYWNGGIAIDLDLILNRIVDRTLSLESKGSITIYQERVERP